MMIRKCSFTVLSRGVRSLFGSTRKSSPWGNFSDGGLNQSIKRRLSFCKSFGWLIDWLTIKLTWTWLVYWIRTARSVFTGAGLKWPNTAGQYSNTFVKQLKKLWRRIMFWRPENIHQYWYTGSKKWPNTAGQYSSIMLSDISWTSFLLLNTWNKYVLKLVFTDFLRKKFLEQKRSARVETVASRMGKTRTA